jgi:phosphoribosylglycinamide formyltransferase
LQALIDANLPIKYVLSNRKAAYGLERAAKASIPTDVFSIYAYNKANPGKTREDYDTALAERILASEPDLVVLAGFMHILSDNFLNPFIKANVRILNLHPALPGEYDGAHAIDRAYADFKDGKINRTGCMIHEVVKEVDRGQPLLIREVPCQEGDTLADLEERIHEIEHVIIVEATKQALQDLHNQKQQAPM